MAHEPPEITVEPISKTVIEGEQVVFRCNASGIPTPSIIWERLGSNLPESALDRNGLLTISSVGAEDAGTYICKAVNSEGEDSLNVQLEVIGKGELLYSEQRDKGVTRDVLTVPVHSLPVLVLGKSGKYCNTLKLINHTIHLNRETLKRGKGLGTKSNNA